jgi:hypothetical protein
MHIVVCFTQAIDAGRRGSVVAPVMLGGRILGSLGPYPVVIERN